MKVPMIILPCSRDHLGKRILWPLYPSGMDYISKLPEGEVRQCEIKNPRNLRKHNLWMAVIGLVVSNSNGKWKSKDHLRKSILIALGLCDLVMGLDGKVFPLPWSMAFENMDEDEFTDKIFEPSIPMLEDASGIPRDDLLNPDNWEEYL